MVVYLDAVLLLNFAIDLLLLWMTAYFRKRAVKWGRLALAASVGSLYVAVVFLPMGDFFYTFFGKFLFSSAMVCIAFGFHRWRVFWQNLAMFYFIAFVTGGGLLGVHYLLQSQSEIVAGIVYTRSGGAGDPVSWTFVLLGIPLMWWFTRKSYRGIQEPRRLEQFLAEVHVEFNGKRVACRGLVDTGNRLHDPLTRTPIMIVESSLLMGVLPRPLLELAAKEFAGSDLAGFAAIGEEWAGKLRFVPFRSVAQGQGLLLAIKPDKVVIRKNESVTVPDRVLIGLHPTKLASDGSYQGIIHPQLLAKSSEEEVLDAG
ncbi:sigma-E processing peptidase SpoIIGA [Bacillaceae bacterium]